jgi:glycerol-3-phosphate dehydrogenase
MRRDLSSIANKEYDLIIVGGGIFGVCVAWDATLRGLSVALLEKGDFSHGTSANHFKIVHGGIRYLQHGDIYRIRESSYERSALLRIAPHLVQPLPIVIPTYGHGIGGKEFLSAGFLAYDLLTIDRNRGLEEDRRIPWGQFLSRQEVLNSFPGIDEKALTGGAVFCDGQMYNPPRLALSFLRSAINEGAKAANYTEVSDFILKRDRILGVKCQDLMSGNEFEISGKLVINTTGPWAYRLLQDRLGLSLNPKPTFSRDLALVVNRRPTSKLGIALTAKTKDADSIFDRGARHLFVVPWRDSTLIGVWHVVFDGPPEHITVSENELQRFIAEANEINPSLALNIDDISMVNTGLTLFGDESSQKRQEMSFGKRSRLIDHSPEHNVNGLITLIGVRATTARGMAAKAIDLAFKKLGKKPLKCKTSLTPIYGGQIEHFEHFLAQAIQKTQPILDPEVTTSLMHNHGCQFYNVINYINDNKTLAETIGRSKVLKAEVVHAVREEMAQKLADVVFRRTDLGTAGHPGEDALQTCATLMSAEMGWENGKTETELQEVRTAFPPINRKY